MYTANKPKIAVDFDGTIVESRYPDIGKPKLFVFETLKKLQNEGFLLILWTYRYGDKLKEAVDFCKSNGIEFYAVNKSYPEEIFSEDKASRKINADIFVDDRNLGGMYSWGEIYNIITDKNANFEEKPKSLLKKIFRNT